MNTDPNVYDDNDDDDYVELDVVDDAPEEDQGRAPLPEHIKTQLDTDEDAEEYSDKVKQRIAQMKKAWHDERRAKEAAERERAEAVRVAQLAYQERAQYQQYLEQNEAWAMSHAKERAKVVLEQAKRAYKDAYDSGDSDQLMNAQEALSKATLDYDKVSNFVPPKRAPAPALQTAPPVVNTPPEQPRVSERVSTWASRNRWFGSDPEMTNFALGVHQKLLQDGVQLESQEYFDRIDARMAQKFPEHFNSKKRQSSTVVAPVGRSPKGSRVVLTKSQVAVAKSLGIPLEQYARELKKLEG